MPDFASEAERSREAKIALRDRLLASRRSRTTEDRRSAAIATHSSLQSLIRDLRPSTIAAYVPVGPEPGGDLPAALAPLAKVLLPALLPGGDLDWVTYEGTLQPGPRGLLEPAGPRLGVDAVRTAQLVIVPALAVDRSGLRLGRGGGSYDRALSRLSDQVTVALLYDDELIDSVPAEPHDRRVRAAITPAAGLTHTH